MSGADEGAADGSAERSARSVRPGGSPHGDAAGELPEVAYAVALAGLPGMGPAALTRILRAAPPRAGWSALLDGRADPAGLDGRADPEAGAGQDGALPMDLGPAGTRSAAWSAAARRTDVDRSWQSCVRRQIHAAYFGGDTYPARLTDDPQPPGVIFWRGRLDSLEAPSVAIVGTRRCTPDGRATAFELGRDLAAAGVNVISGLALGIDGAAHLGALQARPGRPVGVAASGVDVPYPRRHARLWEDVASSGAVVSETPPGAPPQPWRFPSRNRIIVALADLVVLVESHQSGGSLITADAALARGRDLRVVPGPVHSPASAGTNQLLYDGAGPVRHAEDVLDCLGFLRDRPAGSGDHTRRRARALSRPPRPVPVGHHPSPGVRGAAAGGPAVPPVVAAACAAAGQDARQDAHSPPRSQRAIGDESGPVLDAVGWQPTSLSVIVERTGSTVSAASRDLAILEDAGLVRSDGGWWSRVPAAPRG